MDVIKNPNPLTLALDFDGCVHRYSKGWEGGKIYDPPMPGTRQALESLFNKGIRVIIHTTRATQRWVGNQHQPSQYEDILAWWKEHDLPTSHLLEFWRGEGKPLAHVYIDDRALFFENWVQVLTEVNRRFPEQYPYLPIDPPEDDHPLETYVKKLIKYCGDEPGRAGVVDTPKRVLRAFQEMTSGFKEDPKQILSKRFSADTDEMIVSRDISFVSLCEHHLLPFTGTAAVGYIPDGQVVGLSKLTRLVECFAKRFQIQERMTSDIVNALDENVKNRGCGVVIKAVHSCMSCRGVKQSNSEMITSSLRGAFKEDPKTRSEFLSLARIT